MHFTPGAEQTPYAIKNGQILCRPASQRDGQHYEAVCPYRLAPSACSRPVHGPEPHSKDATHLTAIPACAAQAWKEIAAWRQIETQTTFSRSHDLDLHPGRECSKHHDLD